MDDEFAPDEVKEQKDDKSISSDLIRGHINTIILRALYDGDKYGYEIMSEIERKSHGQYSLKEPSLYSALKRLEKNGYVTSYWGGSVAGGRRKYFSLTDEGKLVSEQNQSEWEYSRTVIDSLISDKDFDFNNPAPTQVDMRVLRSSTSRVPSREGEGEELDYEPVFDDSLERARLSEEFARKNAELEEERKSLEEEKLRLEEEVKAHEEEKLRLEEEVKAHEEEKQLFEEEVKAHAEEKLRLEEEVKAHEEEKQLFEEEVKAHEEEKQLFEEELKAHEEERQLFEEELKAHEEEKIRLEEEVKAHEEDRLLFAEEVRLHEEEKLRLEEEVKAHEEEKQLFEEEVKAHEDAADSELAWREQEIATREQALAAERERLEAMRREQITIANAEQEQKEAALAEEAARLEERRRAMDEEEAARRAALEAEESERRRILDEEAEARKAKLDAEEAERKRAFEEAESVRRAALEAEEAAKKSTLAAEELERKRILDEEEASRKRIIEEREQQFNEREAFYAQERSRFADLLRQRDEQLSAERRAHVQELADQERRILQEQEVIFRQREQQILHKNYLDLVNSSARKEEDGELDASAAEQEYRSVVRRIYAGANRPEHGGDAAAYARPLDGIDFHDLEMRASRDGIRVTTTGGGMPAKVEEDIVNTVHKGKMLFLSAIVLLFVCIVEGAIVMAVREKYGIPLYFPYFIWAIGVVVLLVTGLAYANHYGARSIRRNGPALINAVVGYALTIVITFIVALSAKIDFTSTSDLATFIVVPIIFFFGIVIFGICYYILTRPKKKQ